MKIQLPILQDSHNTYPTDSLELSPSVVDGEVKLAITGCDRVIMVSAKLMSTALEALEKLH